VKWMWRILGALSALAVICVSGLWLYGLRPGHGWNSATVEINRPAADVWRYMTTDELTKKWVSGLEEIRHMTPGVTGAGEKLHLVESHEGERYPMEMTIERVNAPRELAFLIVSVGDPSNSFTERGSYQLEERDGKTRVTLSAQTDYHGLLPRLMEPIITKQADAKLAGDLARLKELAEAEPPLTRPN